MRRLARVLDVLGREVVLARAPRRIVSLVPSDTYSLARLGAGDRLVGRTSYCVEPAQTVQSVPIVGGTKDADVGAIIDISPDLVIANQEENSRRDLERIAQANIAVYVSFPKRVSEGLAHLGRLARLLDVAGEPAVREMLTNHYQSVREAETIRARLRPVPTFFPIWMDPLMTVNGETFISDALELGGGANVFADRERLYPLAADLGQRAPLPRERIRGRDIRYPRVTWEEVVRRAPELVLLPDEPYAFSAADVAVFRALDIPAATRAPNAAGPTVVLQNEDSSFIQCVDGKGFSWYGAKALEAIPQVRKLIANGRSE
jgi:ABC-type Fe3+-hydroxamate transport system substrate-binding protein